MVESDNAWVFDSLVCFLNGPIWNAPLQSFIEEKSLIFEANTNDAPDYHKIFEEYKNLVDMMLASYMEDIGISPTQFEEACHKGQINAMPRHFDHSLFEQIWAANDYEMFKRMMAQRNVELQLQALQLIEQTYGITPESFIPHNRKTSEEKAPSGHKVALESHLEEKIMEEVSKHFPVTDSTAKEVVQSQPEEEVHYLQEEKHILQEALKTIEQINQAAAIKDNPFEMQSTPEVIKEDKKFQIPNKIDEDKFFYKTSASEINKVELKKRQEYLRAQRDKLVSLKKEARKRHLDDNESVKEKLKNRPKSARVAEALMTGKSPSVEPQQLQIRKALAERLKAEVINKQEN